MYIFFTKHTAETDNGLRDLHFTTFVERVLNSGKEIWEYVKDLVTKEDTNGLHLVE
jgi:hypothetical protein